MLKADNLVYRRLNNTIVNNVSLNLVPGELVTIIGPNGAGKSTLLRILTGYLKPDSGNCFLQGRCMSQWPHKELAKVRGVMNQQSGLSFPFSVSDVIAMGRVPYGINKSNQQAIDCAVEMTECGPLLTRNYNQLSVGEKQRFQLGR